LEDSASFRAFARLPLSWTPKKSALHKTIGAIRAGTWEAINRTVLHSARKKKVETGGVIRLDSTVTAALMHEPSDSSLLWDAVRVMVRLLKEADSLLGGGAIAWRDRRPAAKKRARAIQFLRGQSKRVQLYRELIAIARATRADLGQTEAGLANKEAPQSLLWQAKANHYRPLIERILAQTERRVLTRISHERLICGCNSLKSRSGLPLSLDLASASASRSFEPREKWRFVGQLAKLCLAVT
jgi:IS5 family transposase